MKDSRGKHTAVALMTIAICMIAGLVNWSNSREVSWPEGSDLTGNPFHTRTHRTAHQIAPESGYSPVARTMDKQSLQSLLDGYLSATHPRNNERLTPSELVSEISQSREKNEAVLHIAGLALRHSDREIRKQAVALLGEIGDELSINVLIDSLAATDLELRQLALSALQRLGNRVPIRPLVALVLHSEDEAVRAEALTFIRRFADPESIDEIVADLQRPDQSSDEPSGEALVQNRDR
jgi:HEAT repeat protein